MRIIRESLDTELLNDIRKCISLENEAIEAYSQIKERTISEDFRKVLEDIINEEKVHIGEFNRVLLDNENELNIFNQGMLEADEIIQEEKPEDKEMEELFIKG